MSAPPYVVSTPHQRVEQVKFINPVVKFIYFVFAVLLLKVLASCACRFDLPCGASTLYKQKVIKSMWHSNDKIYMRYLLHLLLHLHLLLNLCPRRITSGPKSRMVNWHAACHRKERILILENPKWIQSEIGAIQRGLRLKSGLKGMRRKGLRHG